jgi:hypothetical protein
MITFKQFLFEGGAATSDLGTERANKQDMEAALKFIVKHTGLDMEELKSNLLGSTGHTLAGHRKDSGDVDIAFEDGKHNREELIAKMKAATGMEKVHQTGAGTYSFAVPGVGKKKVQVDFMFVPSEEWARFGYHSSHESKYKGVVRAMLFINLMQQLYVPGKDITIKDPDGTEVVRVRRAFKADGGLERLFKIAPMRKDGKGRTALRKATPEEVEAELKRMGQQVSFSKDADPIRDPQAAVTFMFGKGVKPGDVDTAEKIIALIKKRKDHAVILQNAAKDIEKLGLPVPDEIKEFAQ